VNLSPFLLCYLKQQRALDRNDFQAMVEAKTRRFAGVRPGTGHASRDATRCEQRGWDD
jgi:hypothetical protein